VVASRDNLKDNVVQSIVDTSTATIGENKPRPYFLTDGGDYKLQRQSKKLNQFSDGIFYEQKAYELGRDCQRDCEIFGDGWLYVGIEFGRIVFQRALSTELWLDEMEAALAMPRQLNWERPIDRDRLIALYPKKADLIWKAQRADPKDWGMSSSTSDMVMLRKSWHLRSGPELVDHKGKRIKDGVYIASIENVVLNEPDEWAWDEDWYPFARWIWTTRPASFWGQGLAEQLQSQQIEYNRLNGAIQRAMHRAGTYKVLMERGSKIVKEHVSNEVGAIIDYTGTKPEYVVPPAVHPDFFTRLDNLEESMYNRGGVSRMVSQAEKPAGLNSGEAIRQYRDTTSLRMKTQEQLNECGFMDLARIGIATARQIALRTGRPYEVRTQRSNTLRAIKMTAEDLNPKDWRQQCFPTSSLPKEPAGRWATIQEWIQAGFLTMRQGKKLMDFPDLQAHEVLDLAEEDLITSTLDAIMDGEEYRPPEPNDNLQLCKELVVEYINYARLHNLEPERLDDLYAWSEQVDALMQMAMPPPAPGAPGMPPGGTGGPPQAMPMAPPASNLLPFGQRAA